MKLAALVSLLLSAGCLDQDDPPTVIVHPGPDAAPAGLDYCEALAPDAPACCGPMLGCSAMPAACLPKSGRCVQIACPLTEADTAVYPGYCEPA